MERGRKWQRGVAPNMDGYRRLVGVRRRGIVRRWNQRAVATDFHRRHSVDSILILYWQISGFLESYRFKATCIDMASEYPCICPFLPGVALYTPSFFAEQMDLRVGIPRFSRGKMDPAPSAPPPLGAFWPARRGVSVAILGIISQ